MTTLTITANGQVTLPSIKKPPTNSGCRDLPLTGCHYKSMV